MNSMPSGKCSCEDCCNSVKLTGRLYYDLIQFIEESDAKDFVDMKFIDLSMNPNGYSTIKYFIDKGLGMPVTTINDDLIIYGGISNKLIYQEIKSHLPDTKTKII